MKGRIVWGVLGVTVLALAFITSSALLYRLLFGIIVVPLIGYFGSMLAVRGLTGEVRRLTPFLQVGGTLEEQVTLRSRHWWPKLLLEVEHQTHPFGSGGRVMTLWPYQSSSWNARKHCERRGVYEHGVLEVTSRDPLGLFRRTVRVGEPQTDLIYPATMDIPGFFVPSGRGWTEGVVRGRTFSPSSIASTVREYASGDSVSRVHWPATARARKLMIKEFEPEPAGPADTIWIVLDLEERVQAGEGTESTVEYGVTVAASVAKRFLDTGRTVGMAISGGEAIVIKPGGGLAQLGRVLQTLALVQEGAASTLADAASAASAALTPGACIIIVSPAPVDEISAAATMLQAQGATVVPILLEAGSFSGSPPAHGEQYRLPGAALNAYVIHRGDEIERRLDYRVHGGAHGPLRSAAVLS